MSGNPRQRKPSYNGKFVTVHVCCNDADNGNFIDHAEGLEFERGKQTLTLELCGYAPRFAIVSDTAMRIFRRTFVTHSQHDWVGNWSWNAYALWLPDAAWLLQRSLRDRLFSITGASGNEACSLSELLDAGLAQSSLVETMLASMKSPSHPPDPTGGRKS